ncbi:MULTISPECIES: type II secretion system protein GspL [unclassified Acidovorax]|uniref:type II secretion system protein GspL n=1 Tax=unclassified Acidovorax TaxID=2684926 RepID=UPI00070C5FE3|nr:type II secretion system protein GspL [Acidovorax sp. Root217]KRC28134.1 general secretion pathway protein GspL [Acidovorax sp. Root217]
MSTLILSLPPSLPGISTQYGYTLTADGHTAQRHALTEAALLPETARPGEVVAVVPIEALSWQKVQLPPGLPLGASQQTPRLRSVLDGLLEDRLLDDTAQLHFALQPGAQAGVPVWVAVCDRAWLRAHLQALEAAGRRVSRVVPEFAPGPTASGGPEVSAIGTADDPQLILCGLGADQGISVLPLTPATLALAGLGAAGSDAPPTPLRADPAVAELAERALGHPVDLHTASARALDAARGDWDLAQFDLSSTSRSRALRKAGGVLSALLYAPQWRAARWALGVLVLAHLAGLNVWAWQERQALAAKQTSLRSTFTQTFPQVQAVIAPLEQMEREMALLRQASGSFSPRDLEPMMAAAGSVLPDGRIPTGLEFTTGELRLRGLPLAPQEEPVLTTRLRAAGYTGRLDDGSLVLRAETAP